MRPRDEISVPIPHAAMKWAKEEAMEVKRRNPWLGFDDLAATLILRGVIVAATAPELRAVIGRLADEEPPA